MEPEKPEKKSIFLKEWLWLKEVSSKLLAKLNEVACKTAKIAKDDPRRMIHSLKVGSAVTLVSFLYYFQALYSSFGVSAMWAVMTVIVVFEFSVGATIAKGLNRGLATLAAGALGLGAHHLANLTGESSEPFLIGLLVFIQAVVSTFIRFFPEVKARYDYGMLIFILTFCLVSISGFRTDEILQLIQTRLLTILIGASTCVILCIFVYPVWAGEDLHKFVAHNLDELGTFLEDSIAAVLIDTIDSVEHIADAVNELSSAANFKGQDIKGAEGDAVKDNSMDFVQVAMAEIEIPCVSIKIEGGDRARIEGQSSIEAEKQTLMA